MNLMGKFKGETGLRVNEEGGNLAEGGKGKQNLGLREGSLLNLGFSKVIIKESNEVKRESPLKKKSKRKRKVSVTRHHPQHGKSQNSSDIRKYIVARRLISAEPMIVDP